MWKTTNYKGEVVTWYSEEEYNELKEKEFKMRNIVLIGVLIILTAVLYCGLSDLNKNLKELVKVSAPEYIQEIPTDYIGE